MYDRDIEPRHPKIEFRKLKKKNASIAFFIYTHGGPDKITKKFCFYFLLIFILPGIKFDKNRKEKGMKNCEKEI